MILRNLLFAKPTDNLMLSVALTVFSGTEDPEYPLANLRDLNPANPMKFTTTTGRIVMEFGSATKIDGFAIVHHNLAGGLNVKLEANSTSSWGAPPLSQSITIPAAYDDGFVFNPYLDLATLVPVAGNRTYKWWSLAVIGTNSAAIALGEFWLNGTRRVLTRGLNRYPEHSLERPVLIKQTDRRVRTKYDLEISERLLHGDAVLTDAELTLFESLYRQARGQTYPFLIVPDINATNQEAWMVDLDAPAFQHSQIGANAHRAVMRFHELSRGLAL